VFKSLLGQAPVAQACNPTYSGSRDQKDPVGSKPWQRVDKTLSPKNPSQKRADGVAQCAGPEFKRQYKKKFTK
jgi:hypothetical protein